MLADVPDELSIPLPPSAAGSEYGDSDGLVPAEVSPGPDNSSRLPDVGRNMIQAPDMEHDRSETVGNRPGLPSAERHESPPAQASVSVSSSSKAILDSLDQVLREDAYECVRFESLQSQVQDLMLVCHITERLISRQLRLYRMMLGCLKSDNSAAFASYYSHSIQIQETQSHLYHPPMRTSSTSYSPLAPFPARQISWLHRVSPEVRRGIIHVITRIRSDPKFLAQYLTNLPSSHLNKLAYPHRQAAATESVLRNPIGSGSVGVSAHINSSISKDELVPLDDVEHDPLFLLINCVFRTSGDPGSMEKSLQCDVWSTVCARIVEEGKADSDEFCLAILNIFAGISSWPIRPQLETFLAELMQSGLFVLEPSATQAVDFTRPKGPNETSRVANVAEFFEHALRTLIRLLTGGSFQNGIPEVVFALIHATLSKIGDPAKRASARKFFIRWYCTSYISNALIYPEVSNALHPLLHELQNNTIRVLVS